MKKSLSSWLGEVRNTDIFTTFSISTPHLTNPPGGATLKADDNKDYRTKLASFG